MPLKLSKNIIEKFQWKCTLAKERYLKMLKKWIHVGTCGHKIEIGGKKCPLLKIMWAVKTQAVYIYAHMPTQKQQIHKISLYNSGHVGMWAVGRCKYVQLDN